MASPVMWGEALEVPQQSRLDDSGVSPGLLQGETLELQCAQRPRNETQMQLVTLKYTSAVTESQISK